MLSDIQWKLHDLIRIRVFNGEITFDSLSIFIGILILIISTLIMWRKWKKEINVLIDFYIITLIGLLISQPIYLLFILLSKGYRGAILEFLKGGMTLAWLFTIGLSFLYLFFYHRKKLLDFYDHLLPFLAFLLGWVKGFHCFVFGCCYGKPTNLPWGVVFHPQSPAGKAFPGIPLHPVQLYNTIGAWIIIPPALWLLKRKHFDGEVMLWMLFYMGLTKTFEFPYFRGDLPSPMRIWFISIPTMVITLFFLLISYYKYLSKKDFYSYFK